MAEKLFYKFNENGEFEKCKEYDPDCGFVLMKKNALKKLEKAVEDAVEEKDQALFWNKNLKRIMIERANSDRKIKPKKEHDGFIVLDSRQWTESYERPMTEEEWLQKDAYFQAAHPMCEGCEPPIVRDVAKNVWKSTVQTPYEASIPFVIAGEAIYRDIGDEGGLVGDIGCDYILEWEHNGDFSILEKEEKSGSVNTLYKWIFRANYKSGFWEMEIFTTDELDVPENRR